MGSLKPQSLQKLNASAALDLEFHSVSLTKAAAIAQLLQQGVARELGHDHECAILCDLLNDVLSSVARDSGDMADLIEQRASP